MQEATAEVFVHAGCSILKRNLTPAHVAFLRATLHTNCGHDPVRNINITREEIQHFDGSPWTGDEERSRLRQEFGYVAGSGNKKFKIDDLYPGMDAKLPQTFTEVEYKKVDESAKMHHGRIMLPGAPGSEVHDEGVPSKQGSATTVKDVVDNLKTGEKKIPVSVTEPNVEDDGTAPEAPNLTPEQEAAMRG